MHAPSLPNPTPPSPAPSTSSSPWLARLAFALLAAFMLLQALRSQTLLTTVLVASALLMFGACWANATQMLGARRALRWVLAAVLIGWGAEQAGATLGWFFGAYHYTAVLGPRIGAVPAVIPLMWFALVYTGFVLANLLLWRRPGDAAAPTPGLRVLGLLMAALLVTAFDLGADPLFVRVFKAWVMVKTDGGWFGETLQGFVGWTVVALAILLAWQLLDRGATVSEAPAYAPRDALVPMGLYGASLATQLALGKPGETRVVALFAMGLPLLAAVGVPPAAGQEGDPQAPFARSPGLAVEDLDPARERGAWETRALLDLAVLSKADRQRCHERLAQLLPEAGDSLPPDLAERAARLMDSDDRPALPSS